MGESVSSKGKASRPLQRGSLRCSLQPAAQFLLAGRPGARTDTLGRWLWRSTGSCQQVRLGRRLGRPPPVAAARAPTPASWLSAGRRLLAGAGGAGRADGRGGWAQGQETRAARALGALSAARTPAHTQRHPAAAHWPWKLPLAPTPTSRQSRANCRPRRPACRLRRSASALVCACDPHWLSVRRPRRAGSMTPPNPSRRRPQDPRSLQTTGFTPPEPHPLSTSSLPALRRNTSHEVHSRLRRCHLRHRQGMVGPGWGACG